MSHLSLKNETFLLSFSHPAVKLSCTTLVSCTSSPQMSFHVIYKAPCGLCLRNMAEIQHYLFQTRCDFIFLEMFCLDPYVLVDRPFQPQRPFYYIPDITGGKEDIPLSCVNEIDSTPPPKVAYSKDCMGMVTMERLTGGCAGFKHIQTVILNIKMIAVSHWLASHYLWCHI